VPEDFGIRCRIIVELTAGSLWNTHTTTILKKYLTRMNQGDAGGRVTTSDASDENPLPPDTLLQLPALYLLRRAFR